MTSSISSGSSGSSGNVDEAAVVARARRDPRAFGVLYDAYVDRVYRFCYRRLGSHHDAEDATAQAFRRALEGMEGYEWTGAPFGAWLFRISANVVADLLKRRGRVLSLDASAANGHDPPDGAAGPLDEFLAEEELSALWHTVHRLPRQHEQVLVLRYGQGLTNREVSRIINRSETATRQLVYRALKLLKERLGEA